MHQKSRTSRTVQC